MAPATLGSSSCLLALAGEALAFLDQKASIATLEMGVRDYLFLHTCADQLSDCKGWNPLKADEKFRLVDATFQLWGQFNLAVQTTGVQYLAGRNIKQCSSLEPHFFSCRRFGPLPFEHPCFFVLPETRAFLASSCCPPRERCQ
jgi:hypothetical protein